MKKVCIFYILLFNRKGSKVGKDEDCFVGGQLRRQRSESQRKRQGREEAEL